MLYQMIYVSTAVVPMSESGLVDLLKKSRSRNEQNRLTGMLLYRNGHFMQALEGDETNVMKTYGDIVKDARHKSVDLLRSGYIQYRDFPNWTMGIENIDTRNPSTIPDFTRFLELDFRSVYFAEHSVEAHAMLLAFKQSPPR